MTHNFNRGYPVYMAPELLLNDGKRSISISDLKHADMWSYSMVLHSILNPDTKYPYQKEFEANPGTAAVNTLKDRLSLRKLPMHGTKYQHLRASKWSVVHDVYKKCARFEERPASDQLQAFFEEKPKTPRYAIPIWTV
jgi:hypothetical protein